MILTETGIAAIEGLMEKALNWLGFSAGRAEQRTADAGFSMAFATTSGDAHNGSELTRSREIAKSGPVSDQPSATQQRARVIALRGFSQARSGDFQAARETFAKAAQLDFSLDLRTIPSFWALPRQAHQAAADALYDVQRNRDAAALVADINTKFRPRAVPSRQT